MNRLTAFQDSHSNTTNLEYDADGRRKTVSCPNGTLTSARFDIVGKVLGLVTTHSSSELLNLQYAYNLAADRLGLNNEKASVTYHLDEAGRLIQETTNRGVTQHREHLAQGELSGCLLDSENPQVQLIGVTDDFHQLHLDRWQFHAQEQTGLFNWYIQPKTLGLQVRAGQDVHLIYPTAWTPHVYSDGTPLHAPIGYGQNTIYSQFSLRRPLSGDFDLVFEWDGWDCVKEETGSSVTIYHIPDGTLHSFSLDGAVFQCHPDALGSVRMITDASGTVVARLEYGAWGEEIFVSAIPALANFPYRFVGALGVRTDSETRLVYMRARWYDPGLARFISRDPIGLRGGTNLYSYVENRPQRFTDPHGSTGPGSLLETPQVNFPKEPNVISGIGSGGLAGRRLIYPPFIAPVYPSFTFEVTCTRESACGHIHGACKTYCDTNFLDPNISDPTAWLYCRNTWCTSMLKKCLQGNPPVGPQWPTFPYPPDTEGRINPN